MKTIYLATTAKEGCLKISQYLVTLPRPGQALSWHLRPRDRKVTTTGYCYNLQSSIVWTILNFVLWWRCPHSHLSQWLQWSRVVIRENWAGNQDASFSASIPRLIALMLAEIFWFPLMQDTSLIRLVLKACNWLGLWDDQGILAVLYKSVICNIQQCQCSPLPVLAVSRH